VWADDKLMFKGNAGMGAGRVGMLSILGGASFAGVAYTRAYETWFGPEDDIENHFTAGYGEYRDVLMRVNGGGVSPSRSGDLSRLLTSFVMPADFKANLHITPLKRASFGFAGIYPVYINDKNYVRIILDTNDMTVKIKITQNGESKEKTEPYNGGDIRDGLTFDVFKKGKGMRVLLSGKPVFEEELPSPLLSDAVCGFISSMCECRFDYFGYSHWN